MGKQSAAIGDRMRREAEKAAKALVLQIDRELRKATPIDTGHARANWVPSIGQPHTGEVEGEGAHAAGVAAVLGFTLEAGALWVANAAPYVNALNFGHSKQQAAGWVERSVDLALQTIQQRYSSTHVDVTDQRSTFGSAVGGVGAENLAAAYSPFGGDE